MTPAHTDSPLRRSEAGVYRDGVGAQNMNVTINDDEEERRQARRRTMLQSAAVNDSSTFEDNETLKKCLEIYNGNKLSRENAWSLSLIDTLSALLDRHHKSLNNFKVAGSSLEASSKVYGLRVDSIHTDVLRMSAGLNAQKFNERNLGDDDDDDGVATGGDGAADPNSSAGGATEGGGSDKTPAPKSKPKRQRRLVSTITKNKDTLNARLDTVPLQDPVFGKLNSIVGSINSSNRLMINILLTTASELRLRTNFPFWDSQILEACDYTLDKSGDEADANTNTADIEMVPCDTLLKVLRYEELQLRPLHSGYIISDTPEAVADDKYETHRVSLDSNFDNGTELSMAFDINAECEPVPLLNEPAPMLEVDCGDFDDLTSDERTAIKKCRGLRKAPVLLEDLRPVDASSKLEYSYRPLDKISQFWAGPSHWKFKRSRPRPSTLSQQGENVTGRTIQQRGRRAALLLAKKRSKQINFTEFHDELFVKLDNKYKARKTNVQRKWDQRKLKLPTDLQLDTQVYFKFKFAPGLPVEPVDDELHDTEAPESGRIAGSHDDGDDLHGSMTGGSAFGDDHFADAGEGVPSDMLNASSMLVDAGADDGGGAHLGVGADEDYMANNTVLEIATDFEGAPSQVTKIIVPFAKRAKVIDMKNLKRCCTQLLHRQMRCPQPEDSIPQHPIPKPEKYSPGMASFKEIYKQLPLLLNQTMAEALSTSVAFYSVLHLANDYNLRLIPQEDLEDFKIRQVVSGTTPPTTPR